MPADMPQIELEECLHGFSNPMMCDFCNPAERRMSAASQMATVARVDGSCPQCGTAVVAGETLVVRVDGEWLNNARPGASHFPRSARLLSLPGYRRLSLGAPPGARCAPEPASGPDGGR
jgi:hypothetical protein